MSINHIQVLNTSNFWAKSLHSRYLSWDLQFLRKMITKQQEMQSKNAYSKCTWKYHQLLNTSKLWWNHGSRGKLGPTIPPQDAHQSTRNAEQECTLKMHTKTSSGFRYSTPQSPLMGWTHGGRLKPTISFSKILARNATWNADVWEGWCILWGVVSKGKTYRRAYRKRTNCQTEALVRTDSHCTSEYGRNFEIQQAGSRLNLHLRVIYVQADRCL